MKHIIIGFLLVAVSALAAMYVLNPYGTDTLDPRARIVGYMPYMALSTSMEPTVPKDAFLIADTTAYASAQPERFDVVLFKAPHHDSVWIKRVIANGGESIEIRNGMLYINEIQVEEPHIDPARKARKFSVEFDRVEVPENTFS